MPNSSLTIEVVIEHTRIVWTVLTSQDYLYVYDVIIKHFSH